MSHEVELKITRADIAEVDVDLLLLKFARRFYGADEMVATRLSRAGRVVEASINPAVGEVVNVESEGAITPKQVMFLGAPNLAQFRYKEMRQFAFRAIEVINIEHPGVESIGVTVHGVGYGLDIEESFHALIYGFQRAFARGLAPRVKQILFIERNGRRFEILSRELALIPSIARPAPAMLSETDKAAKRHSATDDKDAADAPTEKKLVFVAMPFEQAFEDVYQFGIYDVVRRCGFVCERVDESFYAGNIVERIMEGISRAEFVIADLTTERPNVYLEVGYAWGLGKPTVLIAREGQKLHFDLAQHKCIFYPTIVKLADELEKTIRDLFVCD